MDAPLSVTLKAPFYTEPALDAGAALPGAPPLAEIHSQKVHQALITKDVLFGLLGYEGNYVRFSERYDAASLHSRIQGPDHKVAKHLDVSLKTAAKKLLRYGKYYSGLEAFAAVYTHPRFGRANQRLCHEIARFLDGYRRLVLSFEAAFNTSAAFSLAAVDNELSRACADNLRHLYDVACTVHADTERRNPHFRHARSVEEALAAFSGAGDNFNTFLQSVRNDVAGGAGGVAGVAGVASDANRFDVCKGGVVLQIVHDRIGQFQGDRVSTAFLSELYEAISQDYVALLNRWLRYGEVNDPFQEFLIKKNDLPQNIFYSNMERYWEELYVVKLDGLISQLSPRQMQTKVLATGKLLNVFRQCIGTVSLRDLPAALAAPAPLEITSLFAPDLASKVAQFHERANALFMRVLFQGYRFHDILASLHHTFLLSDSFQIDTFLEKTFHELGKSKSSASTIIPINLYNEMFLLGDRRFEIKHLGEAEDPHTDVGGVVKTFEKFTIDATNFYDIAEEILNIRSFDAERVVQGDENASSAVKRLVSQSLQRAPPSATTTGSEQDFSDTLIAGANIDLRLPFPLNLIITENLVFEYQLAFKLQMLLKYPSKLIDVAWKDITYSTVWNYKNFSRPVQKLVLRCRVLMSRMRNFLNCLQAHFNFNVIEAGYKQLSETAQKFRAAVDKTPAPKEKAVNESHFYLKHSSKNSIFDAKISTQRQVSSAEVSDSYSELAELASHIGTYLNNMLRDLMITNTQLLRHLRALLGVIAHFTSTTGRLKKTLVSMDADLLRAFSRDFPGKFDGIEHSEALVNNRISGLANVLTGFWTDFNDSLQEFTSELQASSSENASFGSLVEKLAEI